MDVLIIFVYEKAWLVKYTQFEYIISYSRYSFVGQIPTIAITKLIQVG